MISIVTKSSKMEIEKQTIHDKIYEKHAPALSYIEECYKRNMTNVENMNRYEMGFRPRKRCYELKFKEMKYEFYENEIIITYLKQTRAHDSIFDTFSFVNNSS